VLVEPHFTRLKRALVDALIEESSRPPVARAVMQGDLWAAHDVLVAARPRDEAQSGRREELLGLLARSVRKLALSKREIAALPDNYAEARLPFDLFAADGGWIEVEYLPDRHHDSAADFRRATRVFLKPSSTPRDRDRWLDELREARGQGIEKLDAVALVVQLLLVDADGVVAPTRLTYEVQVRTFPGREYALSGRATCGRRRLADLVGRRPAPRGLVQASRDDEVGRHGAEPDPEDLVAHDLVDRAAAGQLADEIAPDLEFRQVRPVAPIDELPRHGTSPRWWDSGCHHRLRGGRYQGKQ
jgi:hypothetical protein